MHKIAILKYCEKECSNCDYPEFIANSITEWEEVDEATFRMLLDAQREYGFAVIEQPIDQPAFVAKTIADYLAWLETIKARERKLQEQRRVEEEIHRKANRERAAKAKAKKLAKLPKEEKLLLFQQLKEELDGG